MLVNLLAFSWSDQVYAAQRASQHWQRVHQRKPLAMLRAATSSPRVAGRTLAGGLRTAVTPVRSRLAADRRHAAKLLDGLHDRDAEIVLVLGGHEPLLDTLRASGLLARLDRWPNVRIEVIAEGDHLFSSAELQRSLDARLDGALERTLARARRGAPERVHTPQPRADARVTRLDS
jgi:hypothetical protein